MQRRGKNANVNIHYINIGPNVLKMAFITLSPTFSLFATNILKLYSAICAPTRLHGMPLLLLNQFLACSACAKILPGKHSVAFILIQSGGVLISVTSAQYILLRLPSLRLHLVHIYLYYHAEDMPSCLLVLIDKEFCILQFHISKKNKTKQKKTTSYNRNHKTS